jgi:hypothetical protein
MAKIAKWNGKSEPNITEFTTVVELHRKTINEKKYTPIDVLRRPSLLKTSIFLAIPWYVSLRQLQFSILFVCLMVFNATFNNISVISWRSVFLVEETGGPG